MFLIGEERNKENIARIGTFIELPSSRENDKGSLSIIKLKGLFQDAISPLRKCELWSFLYTSFQYFLSASPERQFKVETMQLRKTTYTAHNPQHTTS